MIYKHKTPVRQFITGQAYTLAHNLTESKEQNLTFAENHEVMVRLAKHYRELFIVADEEMLTHYFKNNTRFARDDKDVSDIKKQEERDEYHYRLERYRSALHTRVLWEFRRIARIPLNPFD